MNDYIKMLSEQDKLSISISPNRWQFEENPYIISGPCSVESEEMIVDWAQKMKRIGVNALRGGAYKPCTYPITKEVGNNGWKEGLREDGLRFLKTAREETGLPIVSEIMDAYQITGSTMDCIDIVQVGTRNFQNYTLLDALGELDVPILLKRGTWGTIDEILGAVERILVGGNEKVAICLRGVVGMPSYRHVFPSIRWAPDLMMIPALKEL
jgi:3-deoxy-7-phosphoheptulonate synthase